MLWLASCANRKPVTVRYSPPSTAPVQQKITDAKTAVSDVSAAIAEAKKLNTDEKVGHALTIAETRANDAKDALAAAGDKTLLLDSAIHNETDVLNNCLTDKAELKIDRDLTVGKYHKLKFLVCFVLTALACFIAFQLGAVLHLQKLSALVGGFWGIAAEAAAAIAFPSSVFTFFWVVEPWRWIPFIK